MVTTLQADDLDLANGESGVWTIEAGSGVFVDATDPKTEVSGLTPDAVNTFRWTVSKAGCPSISDAINVTTISPPVSNAGLAATICGTTTTLDADNLNLANGESGAWTIEAGTGVFVDANDPKTEVSGLTPGAVNTFRWTVSKTGCTAVSTTVDITSVGAPTSDAGAPQQVCADQTVLSATLTNGTGLWTSTDPGISFDNPTQPNTVVRGLSEGGNTLTWTVSNASCPDAISTVIISRQSLPTVSDAGTDQTICSNTTVLDANVPTVGSGAWNVISGSGTVDILDDPNSAVNGLSIGDNVFRWTISNGACPPSTSIVTITRVESPTVSDAGPDQTVCATSALLTANTPTVGTGTWSVLAGAATVTNPQIQTQG